MSSNRLAAATSPYLLQHADNPVHWREWGAEAFAEARAMDKPVLLSVGYAACHWCHVMAHESFEDADVAAVMNELFVPIKVDREERPDVDQLYMAALHHLGEQGGWPLTMFLTPDGAPFWGGTYFPKEPRWGRPGFVHVLKEVARIYREEPGNVDANRQALTRRLAAAPEPSDARLSPALIPAVCDRLLRLLDPVNGGLKGAPKFPQTPMLDLIWRAGLMTGDPRHFTAVEHTLERICRGGIYDHLGGGFARYAVDETWLVPHFEKMLYDNAQLLDLLTTAWLRSGKDLFRLRIEETVHWLLRDMRTETGAFAASFDADSEGEEGRYYLWSLAEIRDILGPDADAFSAAYDITEAGNFEHRNIPNRLADPFPLDADTEARFDRNRAALLAHRARRVSPGRDDKILADWNGLAIAALARAGLALGHQTWIDAARTAYRFIDESMTPGGRLGHSYRAGRLVSPGFSSDLAAMALAALALAEADPGGRGLDGGYVASAIGWLDDLETWHAGSDGSYRLAAADADDVLIRMRSGLDEAVPNPNGLAAIALIRLHHLTGEPRFADRADRLIASFAADAAANPLGHASLLNALGLRTEGLQIVIVGDSDDPRFGELVSVARRVADPNRSLLLLDPATPLPPSHPAHGKGAS
ncbi:MAG: thioredoxin domain-containing protein, partial [Thermaurantiacus sp.]